MIRFKLSIYATLVLTSLSTTYTKAQAFLPIINNYTNHDYRAGSQNWSVAQNDDGIIYIGNTYGLLVYDGSNWELTPIPGKRTVRSVMVAKNRIYIGAFEEFGYFEKEATGTLTYHSLSQQLKNYQMQNDEIWNIFELDGTIYFQSFSSYFTYNDNKVEGTHLNESVIFFMPWHNNIYAQSGSKGFCKMGSDGQFYKVPNVDLPSAMIAILPYSSTQSLIFTLNNGIYLFDEQNIKPFDNEISDDLKNGMVNKVTLTHDSLYVVGTIQDGVVAMNHQGRRMWKINTSTGLQNNTVLALLTDNANNAWLALDKGISVLNLSTSLRFYNNFGRHIGSIYDIATSNNSIWLGTNQGLYKSDINTKKINTLQDIKVEPVLKTQSQVWHLTSVDNQIFCGNNDETTDLSINDGTMASPVKGGICMTRGTIYGDEVLVQGTYSNLCIYKRNTLGKWQFSNIVDSFINPIRYVEVDYLGNIWASHTHKGIYAIKLKENLSQIATIKYFPSLSQSDNKVINVFTVNKRVVFTNSDQFYTYDDLKDSIVPYDALNKALGLFKTSHKVVHFKGDLYWFIRQNEAALVQVNDNATQIVDIVPFSAFPTGHVDEYQNIVTIDNNRSLFCLDQGIALYTYHNKKQSINKLSSIVFRKAEATKSNSTETEQLPLIPAHHSLAASFNNLHFQVAYPAYFKDRDLYFSYRLVGQDESWSEPTKQATRDYAHLKHGAYSFEVKVIDMVGEVMAETSFQVTIEPPFYLSRTAFTLYTLTSIILLITIIRLLRHIINVNQERIEKEHEEIRARDKEHQEHQIMMLQNDKLEAELSHKSKELASSTMSIIRKNEILVLIKEELTFQKEQLGVHYPNKYYDKICRIIDENMSSDDDWQVFQTNFDRIHENFFRNLKTRYPELTPHDLRLCAYLRLNLSSKDIANLLNISLKGVEVGRYRIRKKLNLESSVSLTDFMINLI